MLRPWRSLFFSVSIMTSFCLISFTTATQLEGKTRRNTLTDLSRLVQLALYEVNLLIELRDGVILPRYLHLKIAHAEHQSVVCLLQILQTAVFLPNRLLRRSQLLQQSVILSVRRLHGVDSVCVVNLLGMGQVALHPVKITLEPMVSLFNVLQSTDSLVLLMDDLLRL